MATDTIEFNGIKYRRYPESENLSNRKYYSPGGNDRKRGVGWLHQEIWKHHNGEIPEGYHIHHKDGDYLNNNISNLECVLAHEHLSMHGKEHAPGKEHMEYIQELAKEWHGADEGRKWHSEHAKRVFGKLKPITVECEYCGNTYTTKRQYGNRFCSDACRSAYRRKSGFDNIEKVCEVCGETFTANRYSSTKTCSRKCGASLRRETIRKKTSGL